MYSQILLDGQVALKTIKRNTDNAFIPFALDNTDYQRFKQDIQTGITVNDPDGNAITGDTLAAFIGTLP